MLAKLLEEFCYSLGNRVSQIFYEILQSARSYIVIYSCFSLVFIILNIQIDTNFREVKYFCPLTKKAIS